MSTVALKHYEKISMHIYAVRPRKDKRGADLISDVLPFGRLWYTKPDDAIGYAMHCSRSHDAVIRVYDAVGSAIETHEHKGDFIGMVKFFIRKVSTSLTRFE